MLSPYMYADRSALQPTTAHGKRDGRTRIHETSQRATGRSPIRTQHTTPPHHPTTHHKQITKRLTVCAKASGAQYLTPQQQQQEATERREGGNGERRGGQEYVVRKCARGRTAIYTVICPKRHINFGNFRTLRPGVDLHIMY